MYKISKECESNTNYCFGIAKFCHLRYSEVHDMTCPGEKNGLVYSYNQKCILVLMVHGFKTPVLEIV